MRELRPERLNSLNNITKQINLGVSLVCGHQSSCSFLSIMSPSITNKIKPLLVMEVKYFLAPINSSYLPVICEYYYFLCLIFFCRLMGKQEEGKADEACLEKRIQSWAMRKCIWFELEECEGWGWDRDYIKSTRPKDIDLPYGITSPMEWEQLVYIIHAIVPLHGGYCISHMWFGRTSGAGWFQVMSLTIGKNVA